MTDTAPSQPITDPSDPLKVIIENIDPVTGYRFECMNVRKKIINLLQNAIQAQKTIVFLEGDFDDLKGLNDLCGHQAANQAMKQSLNEKEQSLKNLAHIENIYLYRPQAGGDEFKIIIIFNQKNLSTKEKEALGNTIKKIVESPTTFKYSSQKEAKKIYSSSGISIFHATGNEDATQKFRELEIQAENKLAKQKTEKIYQQLMKTIIQAEIVSPEKYIKAITDRWGTRRVTKNVLRIILQSLMNVVKENKEGN